MEIVDSGEHLNFFGGKVRWVLVWTEEGLLTVSAGGKPGMPETLASIGNKEVCSFKGHDIKRMLSLFK